MENVIQLNWVSFCCGLILLLCADDALPTLFEKYTQVATSGNYGGTGLGLAICKNLVSYFCVYFMCFFHCLLTKNFKCWRIQCEAKWLIAKKDFDIPSFVGRVDGWKFECKKQRERGFHILLQTTSTSTKGHDQQ